MPPNPCPSPTPAALLYYYTDCFSSGETEKPCVVSLMDDSIHEEDEEFRLVLGTPKSKSPYGASIGEQKEALVTVTDKEDSMYFNLIQNNVMSASALQNRQNSHLFQPIPADIG